MKQTNSHIVLVSDAQRAILESGKLQTEMHAGLWMDKYVPAWNQLDPTNIDHLNAPKEQQYGNPQIQYSANGHGSGISSWRQMARSSGSGISR